MCKSGLEEIEITGTTEGEVAEEPVTEAQEEVVVEEAKEGVEE